MTEKTVTIQKTGKTLKLIMALGVAAMIFGIVALIATGGEYGSTLTGIGLVGWLSGRILAWWNHA